MMSDHTTILSKGNASQNACEFIGVDWGTSSFRLMTFDTEGRVQYQVANSSGVAKLGRAGLAEFFKRQTAHLGAAPTLMCGMVGSSLGWQEVPYLDCPIQITDFGQQLVRLNADFEAYLVPGLRSTEGHLDVMRGEEVQVCGWWQSGQEYQRETCRLCLPGTHSKWVTTTNGQITSIETALTGELFQLASQYSVLVQGQQQWCEQSFAKGVVASQSGKGILHSLFSVRANVVAGTDRADAAESYLSGLLIGTELREQAFAGPIHLIGADSLLDRYRTAAGLIGIPVLGWDGQAMVAAGLWTIWRDRNG
jgi:2-dehydro-3-deoxygalactonokinase